MSFVIKHDDALDEYNEIWDFIKEILSIKFHSMTVHDEKYIKAEVRENNSSSSIQLLLSLAVQVKIEYCVIVVARIKT